MKLRTIADSVRHSTSAITFVRQAFHFIEAMHNDFKARILHPLNINYLYRICQVGSRIAAADRCSCRSIETGRRGSAVVGAARSSGRRQCRGAGAVHVPVNASSARAGNAPCATARFTAETIASSDAVMMLPCIPAPNSVFRDRVVISI
jgi:hypothetical protein